MLVLFGNDETKFALTVISLFGLLAIPMVMIGGNKIRAICERLLNVFASD